MPSSSKTWNKIASLLILTDLRPNLGRTAIMKFLFMLQTVRGVNLGYNFGLYTYGPFDQRVLGDLNYAEAIGALKETMVHHSGGYGYSIVLDDEATINQVREKAKDFIDNYREDFLWVIQEFGDRSAGELELISTIIYVDREAKERGKKPSKMELSNDVHGIKPRYDVKIIYSEVEKLLGAGLLTATQP